MIENKELKEKTIIYQKNYLSFYIGKYKEKKVFIKEYNKMKYKNFHSYEFKEQDNKNNIIDSLIIDKVQNEWFFDIIMKYIDVNLLEYLKITEKTLSYEEIRQICIKINKNLLFMKDNNIKFNFEISNLFLPLDIINNETIKLIKNKEIDNSNQNYYNEIYNLGKLLYYLIFQKNLEKENKLILHINLNSIKNDNLKTLISKMLDKTRNISISEYLNNSFFNKKLEYNQKIPKFNIICNDHLKSYYYYCSQCKINICDICIKNHENHKYIPFSEIGLNDKEINEMNKYLIEIRQNLKDLNKIVNTFERILLNIKQKKDNKDIYHDNEENNFKKYYFYNLNVIKDFLKFETDLNIIDYSLEKNEILCLFKKKEKKKDEEKKKEMMEEEIYEKIINENKENDVKEININNDIIQFTSKYKLKQGKNLITFKFNKNLNNISNMFESCNYLMNIDLSNLIFNEITDMSFIFKGCSKLKYLNLSNINTNNITNMKGTFSKCTSIKKLNLSNFNTSNVKDMSEMFDECSSLTNLNLSNFNTKKVQNINKMFCDCHSLKQLDLSNFITNNITDMSKLFLRCRSLISIDLSNFNTSNVKNMNDMFSYCNNLISINISNFNFNNVSNLSKMFNSCISLLSIDLPNFDNNNISDIRNMFSHCQSLISLDLSKFNTEHVQNMNELFFFCKSLKSLDLSSFNTKNVTDMGRMFSNCSSLISLKLSNFDTLNVTNMSQMFSECSSLKSIDLSNFKTQNVIDMDNMFSDCSSLISLDLSNFQTQNVKNMSQMFSKCSSLINLNLLNFIINDDTNIKSMFYNINVNCNIISKNPIILKKDDEKYES